MAAQSTTWVRGLSLGGTVCLNPAEGMDACLSCQWCVIMYRSLASGRSFMQGSPTEWGASECNREAPKGKAMARLRVGEPQWRKKVTRNACVQALRSKLQSVRSRFFGHYKVNVGVKKKYTIRMADLVFSAFT